KAGRHPATGVQYLSPGGIEDIVNELRRFDYSPGMSEFKALRKSGPIFRLTEQVLVAHVCCELREPPFKRPVPLFQIETGRRPHENSQRKAFLHIQSCGITVEIEPGRFDDPPPLMSVRDLVQVELQNLAF